MLTPPIEHRKALLTLSQMPNDEYESLRTALSTFETPSSEQSEEPTEVSEEEQPLLKVIETIFVMHSVRAQYEMEVPEFVASVMTGLEDSHNPVFSSSELTTAANRLKELLGLDGAISRRSKVRSLSREHGMTFCGFRILTDIRPVFEDDAEKDPTEMVIAHTIKIAYHEAGKHKELFVSADSEDLKKLRKALDRAEQKEATLGRLLKEKQINVSGMGG